MDKRNAAFHRGQVGNGRKIHDFLHTCGRHHAGSCGAAVHHILVIAKDIIGMGCNASGRHMEYGRHPVPRHNVQVRDHQKKALGRSKSRRHGTRFRRSVQRACRTALRLHFHQCHRLVEHIFSPGSSPFIHFFRHRRRGRDGKNCRHFREMIRNRGTGFIAVHGFHYFF